MSKLLAEIARRSLVILELAGLIVGLVFVPYPGNIVAGVLILFSLVATIFYLFGRGKKERREKVLDQLGIIRAYATATQDNDYFVTRVSNARKVRILAINAEMLLRNLPAPFKKALVNGANIEVLIAGPDSDLVREMEEMEVQDGRGPGRSIVHCVRDTEKELASILRDCFEETPHRLQHGIGKISIGHFNTQYRESMIICDEDWVWWTPHLNPARGVDRPTFVAEGRSSNFVGLCIRHFQAVKNMCDLRELPVQTE